jgi:hypothetical protein
LMLSHARSSPSIPANGKDGRCLAVLETRDRARGRSRACHVSGNSHYWHVMASVHARIQEDDTCKNIIMPVKLSAALGNSLGRAVATPQI